MTGSQMQMGRDLALLAPQLAVLAAAVLALSAEMLHRPVWAYWTAQAGLLSGTVLALPMTSTRTTVFMDTFRIDALSVWSNLIFLPSAMLCLRLMRTELGGTPREGTAYSLVLFTTVGALVLAGAGDIMFLVLGVLLTSLGSFALVAHEATDRATEAAMKYFVFGSVASAVMAFGLTYWYGAVGSTLLSAAPKLAGAPLAGAAALVGLLAGLGYKAAAAPFHFWAPDAYDGTPVGVAAFLSVIPKSGAIFALAQAVSAVPDGLGWRWAVAALAVASMTYGNLAALAQSSVVRLLAYSSVAQSGYFLLGIAGVGRSELATRSLVIFAAAYAAMNIGAFAVVLAAGREIADLDRTGRASPWLGVSMLVFLLSLVGVPPLGGFAGKLLLFGAAMDSGYGWLAVVGILNSLLSLGVYLRVIVPMWFGSEQRTTPGRRGAVVSGAALLLTVLIGLGAEALLSHLS